MTDMRLSENVRERTAGVSNTRYVDMLQVNSQSIARSRSAEKTPLRLSHSYIQTDYSRLVDRGQPSSSRFNERSQANLQITHLSPSRQRSSSVSPRPRRKHCDELTANTAGTSLFSNQAVFSSCGPTAGGTIDTSRSMVRYSLFGPNVAPFWEYYTGIPGLTYIPSDTPSWKVSIMQKKNCQIVHIYLRKEEGQRRRREFERIEQERRTCVPEWMKEITERRREKKLALSSPEGSQHCDGRQNAKQDLPPWQKELIMKKKRQQQSVKFTT